MGLYFICKSRFFMHTSLTDNIFIFSIYILTYGLSFCKYTVLSYFNLAQHSVRFYNCQLESDASVDQK